MSRKKDTFMSGPAQPYQRQAPDIEAAKFLRERAAAYVKGKALASDVLEAVEEFRSALNAKASGV